MMTLRTTAFAADQELVAPMMRWNVNGQPAGNGWTSPANNGAFGTDYIHRTGAVKADPYDNKRNETMYFYTDNDTKLQQFVGTSSYAVTFAKGQLPPVKGFWSLTMYDPEHYFAPNALKRYALGTKNDKTLQTNADGSLTIYLGHKSPGKDKESNWLPAPAGNFSIWLRTRSAPCAPRTSGRTNIPDRNRSSRGGGFPVRHPGTGEPAIERFVRHFIPDRREHILPARRR